MNKIIAIQGKRASGKDTAALFLKYLIDTPKCMHFYWLAKLLNFKSIFNKSKIIKYADPLKKSLACILNIDVSKFEDRDFKENWYFNFQTFELFDGRIKTPKSIKDKEFSRQLAKNNLMLALEYDLSIRQILMFYGTDIMRRFFGDRLWIYSTLKSQDSLVLLISDQRFKVENQVVQQKENHLICHITRSTEGTSQHSSESQIDELLACKEYDLLIDNNGSLKDLFYKCKNIIKYDRN